MSSLSPTNLFGVGASALPTLFLEARIHGGGGSHADELITQLGLSLTSDHVDVALFSEFFFTIICCENYLKVLLLSRNIFGISR